MWGSSMGRRTAPVAAYMPCLRALLRTASLPLAVLGPVLFLELARLAAILRSEIGFFIAQDRAEEVGIAVVRMGKHWRISRMATGERL